MSREVGLLGSGRGDVSAPVTGIERGGPDNGQGVSLRGRELLHFEAKI